MKPIPRYTLFIDGGFQGEGSEKCGATWIKTAMLMINMRQRTNVWGYMDMYKTMYKVYGVAVLRGKGCVLLQLRHLSGSTAGTGILESYMYMSWRTTLRTYMYR